MPTRFPALLLSLVPAMALGQQAEAPAVEPHLGGQRSFALAAYVGLFQGFAAGLRLGAPAVGLAPSGGFAPVIVSTQRSSEDAPEFDFHATFQINGDAYVRIAEVSPRTEIGAQGGYRYNTLLGHGGALGGFALHDLKPALAVFVGGGVQIFPDGESRVRRDADLPEGSSFNSFPGPELQMGVSLGLLLFP